jgi:hypothetical protein
LGPLGAADFAKSIAGLVSWFAFKGGQALGDYGDTDTDAASARVHALHALDGLRRTIQNAPTWAAAADGEGDQRVDPHG